MKKGFLIGCVCALALLYSCDSNRVYEKNIDLEDRIWLADSVVSFTFEIEDRDIPYNLFMKIRNSSSYPFNNLYVTYTLSDSLGNTLDQQLKNFALFERKTGTPLGQSSIGDVFDHQLPLLTAHTFNHRGEYHLAFKQYMRTDSLKEVIAIGTRLEKAENKE